jgi:hypothetical protein
MFLYNTNKWEQNYVDEVHDEIGLKIDYVNASDTVHELTFMVLLPPLQHIRIIRRHLPPPLHFQLSCITLYIFSTLLCYLLSHPSTALVELGRFFIS